jgi:hypothetical protein
MKAVIIKTKNEMLKKYVQYFLFFKKTDTQSLHYTTFPNNNLCLAIYKQNKVFYTRQSTINSCIITEGNQNFSARLYGFHKIPFQVDINSCLDQICIVFYPSALSAFTNKPYDYLLNSSSIFEDLFTNKQVPFLEQVFEEPDFTKRAEQLELLLLRNLKNDIPLKLKEALYIR